LGGEIDSTKTFYGKRETQPTCRPKERKETFEGEGVKVLGRLRGKGPSHAKKGNPVRSDAQRTVLDRFRKLGGSAG